MHVHWTTVGVNSPLLGVNRHKTCKDLEDFNNRVRLKIYLFSRATFMYDFTNNTRLQSVGCACPLGIRLSNWHAPFMTTDGNQQGGPQLEILACCMAKNLIMCMNVCARSARTLAAGVQGLLKGPESSGIVDALWCYISHIFWTFDHKWVVIQG